MAWKIPLFKMYHDESDIEAITKVIERGTFWTAGPEIEEFEQKLSDFAGTKLAVTFNSGTSALHSLLQAAKIAEKDVIVPSFTFISTVNSVLLAGGKPKFAEIESETLGLDAEDVNEKITDETTAIVIVHYGGFPARDTLAIKEIAEDHHLWYFEDVAESMGASINGKQTGTFGDAAILSFCQNKIITTGEGGAIITDSEDFFQKAKLIRSHGRLETTEDYFSSTGDMDYIEVGYNYRMSSITAALGIAQLRKINYLIDQRRKLGQILDKKLEKISQITLPAKIPGHFQVYQMYPILLNNEETRNRLQEYLAVQGIMTKVYFNPTHLKTIYTRDFGYKEGDLPITEELSKRELNLPFYPSILQDELDFIIEEISGFFNNSKD